MEEVGSDTLKQKRERSPSFPYIDLETAVEHARKLFRDAKLNEVRMADVAASWGMSAKSGSLMRYVAALGQYGLLDATGGGSDRRYKVSASARRIFEDDRPGIKEKFIGEAALTPKVIRDLYLGDNGAPTWGHDRPADSIAESVLKFDLSFTQEAAKRFLSIYDAAVAHVSVQSETESDADAGGVDHAATQDSPEDVGVTPMRGYHPPREEPVASSTSEVGFSEWFRAKVGRDKVVTVSYKGEEEIGPLEIEKLIRMLEAQKLALEE